MERKWIQRGRARLLLVMIAVVVAVLAVLLATRSTVHAQRIRLSQHGSVSQQIADTKVTIEYNRPVARGRELFGALVPWDRIWCPGANEATTIVLSTDVKFNGSSLAAGSYTIWTEPRPDKWTVIFSKATNVWHIPYPPGKDVLHVTAVPRTGPHMETLTFYFPVVDEKKAELDFHWGTVIVPLQIEVP